MSTAARDAFFRRAYGAFSNADLWARVVAGIELKGPLGGALSLEYDRFDHGRVRALRIRTEVPDRDSRKNVTLTFHYPITDGLPDIEHIHAEVRRAVHAWYLHEADENLYVHGRRIFDPHTADDVGSKP